MPLTADDLHSIAQVIAEMVADVDRRQVQTWARIDALEASAAQGHKARDGRDGVFTEPVRFDVTRDYNYGRTVRHDGGVWYAARDIDAGSVPGDTGSGWLLIVDGIKSVDVLQGVDDPRQVTISHNMTGGDTYEYDLYLPIPLDKGVWQAGVVYEPGDMVSRNGGGWICKQVTDRRPGAEGTQDDWRLFVQRGKTGRDGVCACAGKGVKS